MNINYFLDFKLKSLENWMFSILTRTTSAIAITGLCLTGCATKTLINKDNKTYTRTERVTLVEDNVVAFGRPVQTSTNLPKDSIVIAGQKIAIF